MAPEAGDGRAAGGAGPPGTVPPARQGDEFSVSLPAGADPGPWLRQSRGCAVALEVATPAVPPLREGDVLAAVDGLSVAGLPAGEALTLLEAAPRPCALDFVSQALFQQMREAGRVRCRRCGRLQHPEEVGDHECGPPKTPPRPWLRELPVYSPNLSPMRRSTSPPLSPLNSPAASPGRPLDSPAVLGDLPPIFAFASPSRRSGADLLQSESDEESPAGGNLLDSDSDEEPAGGDDDTPPIFALAVRDEVELAVGVRAMSGSKWGTVAYVGPTEFASGTWVGLVLPGPEGKNDGSVRGVRYFECAANCGLFVREELVSVEQETY